MNEDYKRIPYGRSDFVSIIEQNNYYVDKTMYLPMLEDEAYNLFFIRPRRFGKSLRGNKLILGIPNNNVRQLYYEILMEDAEAIVAPVFSKTDITTRTCNSTAISC